MANSNSLKHKRSQAKGLISIPTPTSSSTFMLDHIHQEESRPRFSGESLTPNDGYSGLFTSGLLPTCHPTPSPTLSSFPSPPRSQPSQGQMSPNKSHHLAPPSSYTSNNLTTPQRRRRSSIIHTTAQSASPKKIKSVGADNGVERALEGVMRNLRVTMTPKKYSYNSKLQSRWSSSTEGSSIDTHENDEDDGGGTFRARKSNETSRSKLTIRSTKSTKSRKGRKSEDTDRDRMDVDMPFMANDVPEVPPVPVQMVVPVTPGRSRRMMNGLVKRLGLTPKKNKQSMPPAAPVPSMPVPQYDPLPLPPSIEDPERTIPRKSSLSTLRSALTKKSSNTTLRSMRSAAHQAHPFAAYDRDGPTPPVPSGLPRPRDPDDLPDCFPSTPRGGRRTPKSSIGQPKLQENLNLSPSHFLKEIPRRAPETPKRDAFDIQRPAPSAFADGFIPAEEDGVIRFEEEHLGDIIMSPSRDNDNPPDLDAEDSVEYENENERSQEIFTPSSKQPTPTQAQIVIQQTLNSLTRTQMMSSPFRPNNISSPTNFAFNHGASGKGRPTGLGLTVDPGKDKLKAALGSPVILRDTPNTMGTTKLRSKRSTEGFRPQATGGNVGPLSMRNINALGLPAPSSGENRLGSRMSRKDPLGIIKRFKPSTKPSSNIEDNPMPFRSDAGDGWSTPIPIPFPEPRPSGERERKLNLGTVESYFDANLGTFGTPKSSFGGSSIGGIPDFTIPPPPSNHSSYTSFEHDGLEDPRSRFEDEGREGGVGQSPEYYFQLERPSQDDIDVDDYAQDANQGRTKKTSEHTIHTMTTGEGVEEWELERYLRDLEREEWRRGDVV
ncbi:hypothetical protein I302_106311 [Kwoniella bestiolae CBS 10118]|uniref:Uncharacterized protein n=1 Tax=Kwoniella bestiolae CBS 10118 TaxID=1296100 RepID=A0A1B9G3K8_9TREE|nr:hypothetical protein I302_05435 [Kwoniella bestiolae CBS 10118]OCF25615.1 hypothetical protein I302_05435 [Kwoniella bestiolae CBS 10118]